MNLTPPPSLKQEELDFMEGVLKYAKPFWIFPGYKECKKILIEFYNDEIDEQTARDNMQEIMDIVSEEYTLNNPNN